MAKVAVRTLGCTCRQAEGWDMAARDLGPRKRATEAWLSPAESQEPQLEKGVLPESNHLGLAQVCDRPVSGRRFFGPL